MHTHLIPILLLTSCLSPLGDRESGQHPDTDTDTDADTDTDTDVILDLVDTIPGPGQDPEYLVARFTLAEPTWAYFVLDSPNVVSTYAIVVTPAERCALEVPGWGWGMLEYFNEGYLRLTTPGTHTYNVFGTVPEGGAEVHVRIMALSEAEVPFGDEVTCQGGSDFCGCEAACNCDGVE